MSLLDVGSVATGNQIQTHNAQLVGIAERKDQMITPEAIENRLAKLSKEIDEAHQFLDEAEHKYHKTKTEYEIEMAHSRMKLSTEKMRVQDVQDCALIHCQDLYRSLNAAEATVKAARANATRIRTQVDIARSIGTSVRASLEM